MMNVSQWFRKLPTDICGLYTFGAAGFLAFLAVYPLIGQEPKLADGVIDIKSVSWKPYSLEHIPEDIDTWQADLAISEDGKWLVIAARIFRRDRGISVHRSSMLSLYDCQTLELKFARSLPLEVYSLEFYKDRIFVLSNELWELDLSLDVVKRIAIGDYSRIGQRLYFVGSHLFVLDQFAIHVFDISSLNYKCRLGVGTHFSGTTSYDGRYYNFFGYRGKILDASGMLFDRVDGHLISFPSNHYYFEALKGFDNTPQPELLNPPKRRVDGHSIFFAKEAPGWLRDSSEITADDESFVCFLVPNKSSDSGFASLRIFSHTGNQLLQQELPDCQFTSDGTANVDDVIRRLAMKDNHLFCVTNLLTRVTLDHTKLGELKGSSPTQLLLTTPIPIPIIGKQKIKFHCENAAGKVTFAVNEQDLGISIDADSGIVGLDVENTWKLTYEPRGKSESQVDTLRRKLAFIERENSWFNTEVSIPPPSFDNRLDNVRRLSPLFNQPISKDLYLFPLSFTVRAESDKGAIAQLPMRVLAGIPKAKFHAAVKQLPKPTY